MLQIMMNVCWENMAASKSVTITMEASTVLATWDMNSTKTTKLVQVKGHSSSYHGLLVLKSTSRHHLSCQLTEEIVIALCRSHYLMAIYIICSSHYLYTYSFSNEIYSSGNHVFCFFLDVNECTPVFVKSLNKTVIPAGCDQICHNTQGNYTCSCYLGYQLLNDGKRCRGKTVLYSFVMLRNIKTTSVDL